MRKDYVENACAMGIEKPFGLAVYPPNTCYMNKIGLDGSDEVAVKAYIEERIEANAEERGLGDRL